MSAIAFNNAATILVSAVGTTTTVISVADVTEFALPVDLSNWEGAETAAGNSWSYITLESVDKSKNEVVRLRNVTANVLNGSGTLTISRIASVDNRLTFSVGDYVELRVTSELIRDISSNGTSVLNGLSDPSAIPNAINGDFYIRTDTSVLFGPVVVSGSSQNWGTGTSMIGAVGPTGSTGQIGDFATGDAGDTGAQGIQGPRGFQGDIGLTGADSTVAGPQGIQGIQGIQGESGDHGTNGVDSTVAGPQGPQGETGAQGIQGIQGIQGETGAQGIQGTEGSTGAQGSTGPQGLVGATFSFSGTTLNITT